MPDFMRNKMQFTKAQALMFTATLIASFSPWALKPVSVLIAYAVISQRRTLGGIMKMMWRSRLFWLTFTYWASLMVSAILNASPVSDVLQVTLPILIVPIFAVVARLPENQQRQMLSAFLAAAFVYTFLYALIFDWSQLLNAEYRGDKDADVFVALNAAFIFVFAIERLVLTRQNLQLRAFFYGLAFYGFMIVVLIKSRGTLAAMLATLLYIYFRQILVIRIDKALLYVIAAICAIMVVTFTVDLNEIFVAVSDLLYFTGDDTRSLSTGSGRFLVWEYSVLQLWPEQFWLGYGPRANFDLILEAFNIHGAHNVVVASLLDGGLIGALPILTILLLPMLTYRRNANCVFGYQFYFIALVAALNENLLFTFGTPFAWAVLAMYAQLNGSVGRFS
jgi:O-antigen ligase